MEHKYSEPFYNALFNIHYAINKLACLTFEINAEGTYFRGRKRCHWLDEDELKMLGTLKEEVKSVRNKTQYNKTLELVLDGKQQPKVTKKVLDHFSKRTKQPTDTCWNHIYTLINCTSEYNYYRKVATLIEYNYQSIVSNLRLYQKAGNISAEELSELLDQRVSRLCIRQKDKYNELLKDIENIEKNGFLLGKILTYEGNDYFISNHVGDKLTLQRPNFSQTLKISEINIENAIKY